MATATKTKKKASTAEHVATLREIAATDPLAAQDAVWAWFERLGTLTREDREAGSAQLADLFACGQPSVGIDGPKQGTLVAWVHPLPATIAEPVTSRWLPWQGKTFHAKQAGGQNRLLTSARWPAKLLWPLYGTRPGDNARIAFDFQTRVERGAIQPDVDVLVIDYAPVESNPGLIIRSIRDELVQVADGVHLGRMLWRHRDGGHTNLAYFALRDPSA